MNGLDFESRLTLGVFRTFDRWYVRLLNAAKTWGILGSGREAVSEETDGTTRSVVFPDLSDEGWPGFKMTLPAEARLSHTSSGMFYRGAHYLSSLAPEELATRYRAALEDTGIGFEAREDHLDEFIRTTDLGGDVRIRIGGRRKGLTPISIGQYRDPARVTAAVQEAAGVGSEEIDWGPDDPDDQ
jgi:hypothetical protein